MDRIVRSETVAVGEVSCAADQASSDFDPRVPLPITLEIAKSVGMVTAREIARMAPARESRAYLDVRHQGRGHHRGRSNVLPDE